MAEPRAYQGDRHRLNFFAAIIGAGAAGLSVAYAMSRLGLPTLLIERAAMGGECLNTGCIPSKTLLAAARRGRNWAQAQAHIKAAIAAIAPMDSEARYTGLGATVLRGAARFTGPNSLDVDGMQINARRIIIATGSRPEIPDFCTGIPLLTNETIWDLPALPPHLLILGGGPMAFEMADAFSALGAKVTMAAGESPLAREDPELTAPLIAALRTSGVEILPLRATGAKPGSLRLSDGREISGTEILVAAGRAVDVSSLNLAAAGIAADADGIKTDLSLRALGHKNVFAAGDCANPQGIGPQRFTHIAGAHAGVIIRQAVFRLPAKLPRTPPVRVTCTSPELAQVGCTLAEAGAKARALTWHFSENDRAIAEGDTTGLIKLVIDKKSRLIGAGIAGPGAGEMIALYALAIAGRQKLSAIANLVMPYPTRGEAGKRAAGAFYAEKLFAPGPSRVAKFLARLP
jgi:pyruvate/2-oxoglutarate dehydrogenase complex dihydrolipoamide dehydrogenase (E3) component